MKAKLVNEALKDVLQPRSKEEVQKEILKRLNQYKIPVRNLFMRAQHAPEDTKILLNFIEKNYFKPDYLIPYNSDTKALLHHLSGHNKTQNQEGPAEWNLYQFFNEKAISAFSNTGRGEVLVFSKEFLDDAIQAIEYLSSY